MNQPPFPEPALGAPQQPSAYTDRAFDAFVQDNMLLWVRFADLHVGDSETGKLIACEVAFQLHERWEHVLAHGNPHQQAMTLLRGEIVHWCAQHGVAYAVAAHCAFRRAMLAKQHRFAVLEESIGIFSAISRLPERQYLAFVLRHILGCPTAQIAQLMGVSEPTVNSNVYYARQNLATQVTLPDETDQED